MSWKYSEYDSDLMEKQTPSIQEMALDEGRSYTYRGKDFEVVAFSRKGVVEQTTMLNEEATDPAELELEARRAQSLMVKYGEVLYRELVCKVNKLRMKHAHSKENVLNRIKEEWLDYRENQLERRVYGYQKYVAKERAGSGEASTQFERRAAYIEIQEMKQFNWY